MLLLLDNTVQLQVEIRCLVAWKQIQWRMRRTVNTAITSSVRALTIHSVSTSVELTTLRSSVRVTQQVMLITLRNIVNYLIICNVIVGVLYSLTLLIGRGVADVPKRDGPA